MNSELSRADVQVRVVIVTYSPGDELDVLLSSLPAALSVPYEIVLADNGSVDGAPALAVKKHGVRLLQLERNHGYGAAANLGAAGADGTYLLVCNPDLELRPGAVDGLLAAAGRWPRAGALGPAIFDPDGSTYPSARAMPSPVLGVGHALLGWWWPSNPFTRRYRGDTSAPVERQAGWLSGACLLLRREAFESVHGFDPGYFMYFEDVDLGDRLRKAGWQNVYVPSSQVVHIGGTTTSRHHHQMLQAHHDSAMRYLSARWPRILHPVLRAALAMRLRLVERRSLS